MALKDAAVAHLPRIAILSDSLSNLLSIRAPGFRDQVEHEIMSHICYLCSMGCKVALQFTRGHTGVLGNELADHVAGILTDNPSLHPPKQGRAIAFNLGKSRLRKISRAFASNLILNERSSLSGAHLRAVSGLSANPLVKKSFSNSRAAERIYNQLRCNILISSRGFCWKGGPSLCKRGGRYEDVYHILYECPSFSAQRDLLKSAFDAEMDSRSVSSARGKVISWGSLGILQEMPAEVMDFITASFGDSVFFRP